MTEQTTNRAVVRVKTALQRQRRIALYLLIAVAVLGVALGLTLFFTSRTAFIDPTDGVKYYVAKKDGVYVLKTTSGDVLSTTEGGNFVTAAGTIVFVDGETGDHSTVAAVLVEDGETIRFDTSTTSYDVLLYPLVERTNMSEIEVHNKKGSFRFIKINVTDEDTGEQKTRFIIEGRQDLPVDQTTLFATLVYCTGRTQTLLRLDTGRVKELGYAEYGLPENPSDAVNYFILTTMDGTTHKVILGDEIPSGDGYFVRYASRDAVYVLSELTASDYNGTYADALLGRVEDYVLAPTASNAMEAGNYFDVTDFKLHRNGNTSPLIAFSYSGSIDKRQNTYYSSIPYVADGTLSGYSINTNSVDSCLYALFTWAPDHVVKLGTHKDLADEDLNEWLKPYGLDSDSYAYQLTFTFNRDRNYKADLKKDVIRPEDQEKHIILISRKQTEEDWKDSEESYAGYYLMYNICYTYNAEDGDFTNVEEGYNMVVALNEEQLGFLFYTTEDWISDDLFTGQIAYMEEMMIEIAPGFADQYPNGYRETFTIDNTPTLEALQKNPSISSQISADQAVIRDTVGNVLHTTQFKTFYTSLLYTACSGYSSLSEAERQAHIDSGTEGAVLVIRIKYVPRELDKKTGYYEVSGEPIVREYCFYQNYAYPRQCFTTVNGVGEFYTVRSRIEKIINDTMKLYSTPDKDPIKYGSLH